jgi:hypothetical protein
MIAETLRLRLEVVYPAQQQCMALAGACCRGVGDFVDPEFLAMVKGTWQEVEWKMTSQMEAIDLLMKLLG